MLVKSVVALVLLAACALMDQTEGLYNNATNSSQPACETCNVVNCYGHVIHNECCFYFAEMSTCEGCCRFEMELDPVSLMAKDVNQSCCAPIYKKHMKSTLWCHCGQDCRGKLTDDRYPGWAYETEFKYDVITKCACTGNDWQQYIGYDPYTYSYEGYNYAMETPKPEETLLLAAMDEIIARKNGNYQYQRSIN